MGTQGEFFERPEPILFEPAADELAPPLPPKKAETLETVPLEVTPPEKAPAPRKTMKDLSIPKLYYSISEVSRLTGIEPYVLRYWETEFDDLSPQKNRAGNRIYSNKDIKLILRIKELLREQRYTIEGAKVILLTERFSDSRPPEEPASTNDPAQIPLPTEKPAAPQASLTIEELRTMRAALLELRNILK